MGKKHKKKTKSEKSSLEGDVPSPAPSVASTTMSLEPPLKLVLKVGGAKTQTVTNESYNIQDTTASDASISREQHSTKKKKKKKKSSEKHGKKKDKTATKREYESYESQETNSQEDDELSRDDATTMEEDNDDTVVETEEDMEIDTGPPKAKKALLSALIAKVAPSSPTPSEKKLTVANRPVRDKEAGTPEKPPLQKVLENLHRTLQRKDVDCFFAWPVNDVIAPGYSSIITQPMDFSTMKKKIDNNEYQSVDEYKNDYNLMCNNATIYNGPDTIYYKAAKKLMASGTKIMKRERLLTLKRAYGHYEEGDGKIKLRRPKKPPPADGDTATEDSSGIDGEAMETDEASTRDQTDRDGDIDLEEETAEEIIEQVLQAAKSAKDRLTARAPNSKIGFLRQDKHGTTTLNILNPDRSGQQDSRVVNLGMLTAKLTHGMGSLPGFKEDKRNKVTPVSYLNYGAYSSFAPSFDSTYSNISKEESDLLYAAYGDKTAYKYAQSIQDYVKDCGDYAVNLVDNLLDVLTNGEHTKANKTIEEKRKGEQKKKDAEGKKKKTTEKEKDDSDKQSKVSTKENQKSDSTKLEPEYDFDSLKSLSDLGIDMSFLPSIEKEIKKEKAGSNGKPIKQEKTEIDTKLNSTSTLIGDLEKTQNERMSLKPPAHLSYTPGPSDQECDIAEKLTQQLLALTSKATPGDVTTTDGVRKAMGVNINPADSSSTTADIPDEEPSSSSLMTDVPSTDQTSLPPDDVDKDLLDLMEGSDTKS